MDPTKLVRSANLVKLSQLPGALSADAVPVTPGQRAQQLAERKAGYARRLVD